MTKFEKHTVSIGIAGVLVAAITGAVIVGQFSEMHNQTAILARQANQADAAFRQQQRAYIVARDAPRVSGNSDKLIKNVFIFDVDYVNVGQSPATDVQISKDISVGPNAFQNAKRLEPPNNPEAGHGVIAPAQVQFGTVHATILETEQKKIRNGESTVAVYGAVFYKDIFDVRHETEFCWYWLNGGAWAICPEHNHLFDYDLQTAIPLRGEISMLNWTLNNFDRILSLIAVVIAVIAMLDVRHLFRTTQERARKAVLQELSNYGVSMASFYRACEWVEFNPGELSRESAALLFATFRILQLLSPDASTEQLSAVQKATRKQVDEGARGYAQKLVSSGIATLKPGHTLE